MKAWLKTFFLRWGNLILLMIIGVLIGMAVAVAEVIFYCGLSFSIDFHQKHWLALTLLLPVGGLLIVWMYETLGGLSKKGMNLVFEVSQGLTPRIPKRTLFMVTICTWIAHIFGASVGREGVAVQIGATISDFVRSHLKIYKTQKTLFLVMGMAAGFSGLFGTPFTAAFFALEVLVAGKLELDALLPTICASFAASRVAALFGVLPETHFLDYAIEFRLLSLGWKLGVLGIAFGIAGGLFPWCLHKAKHFMTKHFPDPYKRIFYMGIVLALVLVVWHQGRYSNTGANLFNGAFEGEEIYPYDFAAKFIVSILSLSIGFIGGEVTPLFTIGATLGAVLGPVIGLPAPFAAALGYAAVFGAGTNTWLASMMIGMELFGYSYFPFFFVVCSIAYMLNNNQSIYSLQKVLAHEEEKRRQENEKYLA